MFTQLLSNKISLNKYMLFIFYFIFNLNFYKFFCLKFYVFFFYILIIVWPALNVKLLLRIHVHCSAVYFKTFFQMISLTYYCRFHIKHKFKIQAFSCFFSKLQEYKSVIEFQTFVLVLYI